MKSEPGRSIVRMMIMFALVFFGMCLEDEMIRDGLFRNGEFVIRLGGTKLVGHVEVKLTDTKTRWVPAGADSR